MDCHFVTKTFLGERWVLPTCKKGTLGTPFCSYKMGLPTPRVQSERGSKKHGDVRNKTWRLPLLDSTSQVCSRDFDGPEVGGIEGLLGESAAVPKFWASQLWLCPEVLYRMKPEKCPAHHLESHPSDPCFFGGAMLLFRGAIDHLGHPHHLVLDLVLISAICHSPRVMFATGQMGMQTCPFDTCA